MEYRILNTIGQEFNEEAKRLLSTIGKVDYIIPSQAELAEKIKDYEIIFCGLGLTFSADIISNASKLKIIVTATTGLDHIDLKAAEARGIRVLSLRGETAFLDTISGTAELSLGLMLSLAKRIPEATQSVLKGEWDRKKHTGHTVRGQTLGVVGLGRLGKMMARYGEALAMNVVFCDPEVSSSRTEWKKVSFEELLATSDYVSIHVHLNEKTEFLFNTKTLSSMKKGASLINTSRGRIVQERDLMTMIDKGWIGGYATDVLDGEVTFDGTDCSHHPLVQYAQNHPQVIIVPHIGGMTFESRKDTDVFMAEKLKRYLAEKEQ
jgi:D-3-phosphoglycerate dehydrogenase